MFGHKIVVSLMNSLFSCEEIFARTALLVGVINVLCQVFVVEMLCFNGLDKGCQNKKDV